MSRFAARILEEESRTAWDGLWSRSEGFLGLHWDWPEAAAEGVGVPVRVGIFSKGDNLVAGLVFVSRRLRGIPCWLHPAPVPFAGLLTEKDPGGESFYRDALESAATVIRGRIQRAEVILSPEQPDARGLIWSGWRARPYYNYVSQITQRDSLSSKAENATRRQAAKARNAGLKLESSPELLPEVLDLWGNTRQRQGIPVYTAEQSFLRFQEMFDGDRDGIRCRVFGVRNPNGELEAGGVFASDRTRVYYLLGGSRLEGIEAGSGAPTLLHFEATASLFEEIGSFLYDWVGANTPSVARFKKKFRPRLEICQRSFMARGLASLIWHW